MKVLNDKGDDLSQEAYIHMMVLMLDVESDIRLCNALSYSLKKEFQNETVFTKKLPVLHLIKGYLDKVIEEMDKGFDDTFTSIYSRPGGAVGITDMIAELANDLMIMKLIYITRILGNDEKRDPMKRALLNFKGRPEYDINTILKYWKIEL